MQHDSFNNLFPKLSSKKTMPEMKRTKKIHKHTKFHTDSLKNKKSYSRLSSIFIRIGSVVSHFKSASLIAEKFQETQDFRKLQSAVTFVIVKISSKFKEGRCTYLVSYLQMTLVKACLDPETFLAVSGDRTWDL